MAIPSISSVDLASVGKPPPKASSAVLEASGLNDLKIGRKIGMEVKESRQAVSETTSSNFQNNKNVDAAAMGTEPRPEQVSGKPSSVNVFG